MADNVEQDEEYTLNADHEGDGFGDEGFGGEEGGDGDAQPDVDAEADAAPAAAAGDDVEEGGDADAVEDPELEAIKARVEEMEKEAEKLKEMQSEVEKQMNLSGSSVTSPTAMSMEERLDADTRSVWVGNVDYGATAEELEAHFHGCGSINRVTILCDKFTGHPKGFAYVEFADKDSTQTAMALDESLFRGRQIRVTCKRTNRPGISTTNRPPRFRGGRGGRGSRGASSYSYGGYNPRPRGRGFRGRRNNYYSPY